jgi:hypothetical protein
VNSAAPVKIARPGKSIPAKNSGSLGPPWLVDALFVATRVRT